MAPRKFLDELARIAEQNGIVLIFDEVSREWVVAARCGPRITLMPWPTYWRWQKASPSGLPLGATIARAPSTSWPHGAHASTFGGNPVSCAAALATIALLQEELVENAAGMGSYLRHRLTNWPARFSNVREVRGLGLMIGIELVRDQQTKELAPEFRDRVVDLAFQRGLLILGTAESTIRLSPPLIITRDQCDFAIETLEHCLTAADSRWLQHSAKS